MLAAHLHQQRAFPRGHEPDAVMNKNARQSELVGGAIGERSALMLCHCLMRFIIDPLDLASIFHRPDDSPKVNHRAGVKIDN